MIKHQMKYSYRYITHKLLTPSLLTLLFVNNYGSMVIPISHREKILMGLLTE